MEYYPMKLIPVPKEIIWGGDRLVRMYGKKAPFDKIAESWELTVRDDAVSAIENGPYGSMRLDEFLSAFPDSIGTKGSESDFPLLIKFIDAEDDLSIQVHPNDKIAECLGGEEKTEMWYIADATDDACIVYGLNENLSEGDLEKALKIGDPSPMLKKISVKKGESYFIPAGQIHAICHGALIAEIQQNSDTTYRVYDYGRVQKDGTKRELHISEALSAFKYYTDEEINALRFSEPCDTPKVSSEIDILCSCKHFKVLLSRISSEKSESFFADESSFLTLLFTDAYNSSVSCGSVSCTVRSGDCFFIPAGAGKVTVSGKADVLLTTL